MPKYRIRNLNLQIDLAGDGFCRTPTNCIWPITTINDAQRDEAITLLESALENLRNPPAADREEIDS